MDPNNPNQNQNPYGPTSTAGSFQAPPYPPAYGHGGMPPMQMPAQYPAGPGPQGFPMPPAYVDGMNMGISTGPGFPGADPNPTKGGFSNPSYGGAGFSQPGPVPPVGFYMPSTQPQAGPSSGHETDDEPKYTYPDDIEGYNFSEKSIRMAFIRKVYSILSLQLGVTVGFIALFLYHEGIRKWTRDNPSFLFASLGVYIVTILAMACCESVRRKAPTNYIFLSVFTLATSVIVGAGSSTYGEKSVLLAGGVTIVVCVALTIFSFQTKWDFTRFGGILFVGLIILVLFGFMTIFLRAYFPITRMIYAALGALLFCAFLVYDTQKMMGGNHKYSISPEEYIFASLNLYLDIINIFLMLLQLFGRSD